MTDSKPEPEIVQFHYLKSSQFRTIHADGAFGGPTPSGMFAFAMFSERTPIPQRVDYKMIPSQGGMSVIGDETNRVGREGVVRELEVAVIMSISAATRLRDFLNVQLKKIADLTAEARG